MKLRERVALKNQQNLLQGALWEALERGIYRGKRESKGIPSFPPPLPTFYKKGAYVCLMLIRCLYNLGGARGSPLLKGRALRRRRKVGILLNLEGTYNHSMLIVEYFSTLSFFFPPGALTPTWSQDLAAVSPIALVGLTRTLILSNSTRGQAESWTSLRP